MATGLDVPATKPEKQSQPSSAALDEVYTTRAAAQPAERAGASNGGATDHISMGGPHDMQALYGKDARIGLVTPVQVKADVTPGQTLPKDGGIRPNDKASTFENQQPGVVQAREQLLQSAQRQFKDNPAALAAFQRDMSALEHRLRNLPQSAAEITGTYGQVQRMLDGHSMALSDKDRKDLAGQVLHQAAVAKINQGNNNDCLAASLETRLYTRAPAEAARLMTDMVLTGSYQTSDHRMIRLDAETMNRYESPVGSGQEPQSYASKIMQATLRNIDFDKMNQEDHTNLRYSIHADDPKLQALGIAGNGETVIDWSKTPPQNVTEKYPGMRNGFAEEVYQSVAGTNDGGFTLNFYTQVSSEEFKRSLEQMARAGKFPATIGVNLLQEPFKTQAGGDAAAQSATIATNGFPLHAITITGYNPKTGKIEYTNHLNGSRTNTIDRDDMFRAMHLPDLDGMADKLAESTAAALKADPSTKITQEGLFEILSTIDGKGREHVLEALSKKMGTDLRDILTSEQQSRLGVYHSGLRGLVERQFD